MVQILFLGYAHNEQGLESSNATSNNIVSIAPYIEVLRGRDGRDGRDGKDGEKGEPGPPGLPGCVLTEQDEIAQGPEGLPGPPGPYGPPGLAGEPGSDGSPGINGHPVPPGAPGSVGPQGPQGPSGEKGERGADGAQGPQGEKGMAGVPGFPGLRGGEGIPGSRGIQGSPGPPGPSRGGVVYTRWGRTTCPSTSGTELVYAGLAAGSWYGNGGGGANKLCLPENPQYSSSYQPGDYTGNYLHGAEYKSWQSNGPFHSVHHHNVPCAVCHVETRAAMLMLPAQTSCPASWTREYYGYLMTEHYSHNRAQYECVDISPESVPGSIAETDGALFYFTEARCAGLPCPPYNTYKEVTCAVCTK